MPRQKPKQEEVSITEAEFKLLQNSLGEDVDLIEGARIHARGDHGEFCLPRKSLHFRLAFQGRRFRLMGL